MGDPAGIGPWLVTKVALLPWVRRLCRPIVVGDASVLKRLRALQAKVHPITQLEEILTHKDVVNVLHIPHPAIKGLEQGKPSRLSGEVASEALRVAATLGLQGRVKGIFTAPVSKESLALAGLRYKGQTEYLSHLCDVDETEMLMLSGRLKIVLLTRHLALCDVSRSITQRRIVECVRHVSKWFPVYFRIRSPKIVVCALNPHAGDGGILGAEERRVIRPAVKQLSKEFQIKGPLSADSALSRAFLDRHDVVLAMYHDQAMIALKAYAPDEIVNVTLGLPFPRVSPGHGTAFDLVNKLRQVKLEPSNAAMKLLISFIG